MSSIGHRNCKKILKEKHPCCTNWCAFRFLIAPDLKSFSDSNILAGNDLFLKTYVTSEGAVLTMSYTINQLSFTCYQVTWYACYFVLSNYQWHPVPLKAKSEGNLTTIGLVYFSSFYLVSRRAWRPNVLMMREPLARVILSSL